MEMRKVFAVEILDNENVLGCDLFEGITESKEKAIEMAETAFNAKRAKEQETIQVLVSEFEADADLDSDELADAYYEARTNIETFDIALVDKDGVKIY